MTCLRTARPIASPVTLFGVTGEPIAHCTCSPKSDTPLLVEVLPFLWKMFGASGQSAISVLIGATIAQRAVLILKLMCPVQS